ncbi:MAG: hypothetical protein Q7R96_05370 [Nanoarchaeota archaeon]|nr:hypothetical protein [Nanoarchaeota archaeon]
MADEQESDITELQSLKDLFINTLAGRFVTLGTGAMIAIVGCMAIERYFANDKIQYRQAIGEPTPDIFIEKDGIKYFSVIDGKGVSDLLK